jgi:hypothetical protein
MTKQRLYDVKMYLIASMFLQCTRYLSALSHENNALSTL